MHRSSRSSITRNPRTAFFLMAALLALLWLSGGASRSDVLGPVLVRGGTWLIAIAAIWLVPRPDFATVKPVATFLVAMIALLVLQLVPLPPAIWLNLPGRDLLAQAAVVSGQPQPWRPVSIAPDGTLNALSSLIVPVTAFCLLASMSEADRRKTPLIVFALVVLSGLVASLQFSGIKFDNPLVNEPPGEVSGLFANRNHFALLVAIGCMLAPVLAFEIRSKVAWARLAFIPVLLFLFVIILASGSRTGVLLGVLGIVLGLLIVRRPIAAELKQLPKGLALAVVLIPVALLVSVVALSFLLGRAVSVERALTLGAANDPRFRFIPVVIMLVGKYWPVGTGYGTFDPVFRISESEAMLDKSYLNHAHNDWLEVVLEGGLPGTLLLAGAIGWFVWKSFAAWRTGRGANQMMAKLGSAIVMLVLLASITDYPARTPMIMGVLVLACVLLNGAASRNLLEK